MRFWVDTVVISDYYRANRPENSSLASSQLSTVIFPQKSDIKRPLVRQGWATLSGLDPRSSLGCEIGNETPSLHGCPLL